LVVTGVQASIGGAVDSIVSSIGAGVRTSVEVLVAGVVRTSGQTHKAQK
jgi:hypothetical protein